MYMSLMYIQVYIDINGLVNDLHLPNAKRTRQGADAKERYRDATMHFNCSETNLMLCNLVLKIYTGFFMSE